MNELTKRLSAEIEKMPVIDVHSHLNRDRLAAQHLDAIIFYHMVARMLISAGMPSRNGDIQQQIEQSLPYWPLLKGSGFLWCLKSILRDLYEFDEPIEKATVGKLLESFEQKRTNPEWGIEILQRAGIAHTLSSTTNVESSAKGKEKGNVRLTIEVGPANMNESNSGWEFFNLIEKETGIKVNSANSEREAISAFYNAMDWADKHALVMWYSSMPEFILPADDKIDKIISKYRGQFLPAAERRLIEAFTFYAIMESVRCRGVPVQIAFGCQLVGKEGIPRAGAGSLTSFANVLESYPDMHFNFIMAYAAGNHELNCLAQAYPNLSVAGAWWHNFYPSVMRQLYNERMDILPINKFMAFFSDAYCSEWSYGRLKLVHHVLSLVLAEKIVSGYLSEDDALQIARYLLFDAPQQIFFPKH